MTAGASLPTAALGPEPARNDAGKYAAGCPPPIALPPATVLPPQIRLLRDLRPPDEIASAARPGLKGGRGDGRGGAGGGVCGVVCACIYVCGGVGAGRLGGHRLIHPNSAFMRGARGPPRGPPRRPRAAPPRIVSVSERRRRRRRRLGRGVRVAARDPQAAVHGRGGADAVRNHVPGDILA